MFCNHVISKNICIFSQTSILLQFLIQYDLFRIFDRQLSGKLTASLFPDPCDGFRTVGNPVAVSMHVGSQETDVTG